MAKKELPLEYIFEFILELIAIAKYGTINFYLFRQNLGLHDLAEVYTVILRRMTGRFPGRDVYIEKCCNICCTENGLTEKELVLKGHMDKDILFFKFPYLIVC